jgi:hypothetical protein
LNSSMQCWEWTSPDVRCSIWDKRQGLSHLDELAWRCVHYLRCSVFMWQRDTGGAALSRCSFDTMEHSDTKQTEPPVKLMNK